MRLVTMDASTLSACFYLRDVGLQLTALYEPEVFGRSASVEMGVK